MVRASGYLENLDDLRDIPLGVNELGTPLVLADVADIRLGPQMRRGIAELNGEGEVVGGVIIMRWGENALKTITPSKFDSRSCNAVFPMASKLSPPTIDRI